MKPNTVPLLVALVLILGPGPSLSASELVLRDGTRLAIRGSWEHEGERVVFRLPNGTLSSLPTSEVDLVASRPSRGDEPPAKESANEPPETSPVEEEQPTGPPPEPAPEPLREEPLGATSSREEERAVRVLTDRDIPRARPVPALPAPRLEEALAHDRREDPVPLPATPAASSGLRGLGVVGWEVEGDDSTGGMSIVGTLRNSSASAFADVRVEIRIGDVPGGSVTEDAVLESDVLEPGGRVEFRASFPEVWSEEIRSAEQVRFDLRGTEYRIVLAPGGTTAEDR